MQKSFFSKNFVAVLAVGVALAATQANAATVLYWDSGAGTNLNVSNGNNWNPNSVPVDDLTGSIMAFDVNAGGTNNPNVSAARKVAGVQVDATATAVTFSTAQLTVGTSGISMADGAAGLTFNNIVTVGSANETWTNNSTSNAITFNAGITGGNTRPFTIAGAGNITTTDFANGNSTLTKNGSGTFTVTGTRTGSGGTWTVNDGAVLLNADGAIASGYTVNGTNALLQISNHAGTGVFIVNEGILRMGGDAGGGGVGRTVTFGSNTATGKFQAYGHSVQVDSIAHGALPVGTPTVENGAADDATITIVGLAGSGTKYYGGLIQDGSGGGKLNLTISGSGAGKENLQGVANTYTGVTTLNSATLTVTALANIGQPSSIGQGSALGSAADLVFGGGTLRHDATSKTSTNRLFTIGNANGDTATIDSSAAVVTVDRNVSFSNTGAVAFGNTNAHTLTLTGTNTDNNWFSPLLQDNTGATSLVKSGEGMWTVSNANSTYSGGTTISDGALRFGASSDAGNTKGPLGTGSLTIAGTGSAIIGAAGTGNSIRNAVVVGADFSLAHYINSSPVILNGPMSLGSATRKITVTNHLGDVIGGVISGDAGVGLTVENTSLDPLSALTLSGDNTYTGVTTVNNGTLQIGSGGLTGSLNDTGGIVNNATVVFNRSDAYAYGGIISGAGAVAKQGGGTLTLSNANSYSGGTLVAVGTLSVTGSLTENGSAKVGIAANGTAFGATLTRAVNAGANAYAGFGSTIYGDLASTADVLASDITTASHDLLMQWRERDAGELTLVASDVLNLSGMDNGGGSTDKFVLQMKYDPSQLPGGAGNEAALATAGNIFLGWLDGAAWKNAIAGNVDANTGATNVQGTWAGAGGSTMDLGAWGIDVGSDMVWAVLDHNSAFAVVPEPGTLVLLATGLLGLIAYAWRKRK